MARRKTKSKAKGKNVVSVDFTGVEGRILLPEDEYQVIVEEVKKEVSDGGNDYLAWKFKTITDDDTLNDKPLYYNTSLQPQALWNLRNLLETLGIDVPDGPLDIKLDELVNCEMIAVVENETYEGKKKSKVVDFMPSDEEAGEVSVEGEEVEGVTEEEIMESDEDGLDEITEKYDLDINLKKARTLKKKREMVLTACEKEGYLVEDEEGGDDDLPKLSVDEISDMDAKELKSVVEKYELTIDLKDYKTKRKKINAVVDALEEKDLLEDE